MKIARPNTARGLAAALIALLVIACGGDEPARPGTARQEGPSVPNGGATHALLGDLTQAVVDDAGILAASAPAALAQSMSEMADRAAAAGSPAKLVVDYPLDQSVFPPEFVAPTFLWHDSSPQADTWLIRIESADKSSAPMTILVPGVAPPEGELDPEVLGLTDNVYHGTDYQNSARSWTPTPAVWEEIKQRSAESKLTLTFLSFRSEDTSALLSRGAVSIVTSRDPVGAPIFYRDVPLMASVSEQGRIKPLGEKAVPTIAWRLRDVSKSGPKLILKGMPSCGNCHSFSLDGKTLGMDVDGPDGDKGMYTIKEVSKNMVIEEKDTITWNSFSGKLANHRTIGFLSRISPDGGKVVTTVNETLFVSNFTDYRFLQVFYPAAGILAWYSREDDVIRALPGANDPAFVHCDPAWSPDGEHLIFSRAPVFDPYPAGTPIATRPNDPNEPQVRYDLYRMPFDGGKGGKPVPVAGASQNGMSNTFPKVSPDGKWIVYVKCKNGQLLRPDSRLWIVPFEGGEAREMRCNTSIMNSWHSFSPNGRWMVFSSKSNTPFTQAFLTHIDEDGNDSPAILIPNCTAANRAVNLPEFLNAGYDTLDSIDVPAVEHHVHFLAGSQLLREGRQEEGIAALKKAVEMEPAFSRAHAALAVTLAGLNRVKEGLPHFERAAELTPDNPLAFLNLGIARNLLGQEEEARKCFERAIEISPGLADARILLAEAHTRRGRTVEAIDEFLKAAELVPNNGDVRWELFLLLKSRGRIREARAHLERAAELKPGEPGLIARLAWELATSRTEKLRDGPRAVELAKRAVSLSRGAEPQPFVSLSAAFAESGKFERAIQSANQALSLIGDRNPDLANQIRSHLAQYRKKKPIRQDAVMKTD